MINKIRNLKDCVIDCHSHCGTLDYCDFLKDRNCLTQNVTDLSYMVKMSDIDYAVTFPYPTTTYYNIYDFVNGNYRCSDTHSVPFQHENLKILKDVEKYRINNILPFMAISLKEKVESQIEFIETCMETYPIYGLKYHPERDCTKTKDLLKNDIIFDFLKRKNIPIIIHSQMTPYSDPNDTLEVCDMYRDVRVSIAHLGRLDTRFLNNLAETKRNNVFIDCCPIRKICRDTTNHPFHPDISTTSPSTLIDSVFEITSNILWGSDSPYNVKSDEEGNSIYEQYQLDVDILNNCRCKHTISVDNPRRFLFGDTA